MGSQHDTQATLSDVDNIHPDTASKSMDQAILIFGFCLIIVVIPVEIVAVVMMRVMTKSRCWTYEVRLIVPA
jgi:t-SNARE complex subunit (syntaxin)